VSHAVYLFYSMYVLELIFYCETHRFLRLYVFVVLSVVIWNYLSVVGCRQSVDMIPFCDIHFEDFVSGMGLTAKVGIR